MSFYHCYYIEHARGIDKGVATVAVNKFTIVIFAGLAVVSSGILLVFSSGGLQSEGAAPVGEKPLSLTIMFDRPLLDWVKSPGKSWPSEARAYTRHEGEESLLLVELRHQAGMSDSVVTALRELNYDIDSIRPAYERILVWVRDPAQLRSVAGIEGVSFVSLNTDPSIEARSRLHNEVYH